MVYSHDLGIKQDGKNRVAIIIAAVSTAFIMTAATFSTSFAAGNEKSGFTTGDCISDGLYGNEPNMKDGAPGGPAEQEPGSQAGSVVPSQSPGPFANNPNDPDNPNRGRSVGHWQQEGVHVPQICHGLAQ